MRNLTQRLKLFPTILKKQADLVKGLVLSLFYLGLFSILGQFKQNKPIAKIINQTEPLSIQKWKAAKNAVRESDFLNIWSAAKLTLAGKASTLFDLRALHKAQEKLIGHTIPMLPIPRMPGFFSWIPYYSWCYPPHILLLIAPLGLLSYGAALKVFLGATFIFYALSTVLYQQKWKFEAFLLVFAPTTILNVCYGQNGFLTAALLIGGLRLLEKRPTYSGILFGLLTIKPQMGLLIPFALITSRSWHAAIIAVMTAIILVSISMGIFGADLWWVYLTKMSLIQKNILQNPHTLIAMTTLFIVLRNFGASVPIAYAVQTIESVIVVVYIIRAWSSHISLDKKIIILLIGTTLVSPYEFCYDLPIISSAIILILESKFWKVKAEDIFLLIVWIIPFVSFFGMSVPIIPIILMIFFLLQIVETEKFIKLARTKEIEPLLSI